VRKIAVGSLKNKLLFLLPGALVLSFFAPWVITPLLMAGGAFLCLEGYHKVMDIIHPGHHAEADTVAGGTQSAQALEDERVGSAIRTDFILSAEIMAITLASVSTSPLWMQGSVLAVVGIGMTLLVYGAVAVIVKADDIGIALARSSQGLISAFGRGIVKGMPYFLKVLSTVGMVAMLWVGGGIIIHGLHELGVHGPEESIHQLADSVSQALPSLSSLLNWLTNAGIAAVLGLLIGAIVNPLAERIIIPLFTRLTARSSGA
jgi:predicted DNA repair protein MutK